MRGQDNIEARRERIYYAALARAARRDRAVAAAQVTAIGVESYARLVWLAEEAMTFVLRMARGEI
ncbi:MAG: hypothetical protein A3A80_04305 [Candidatus Terrybacteria bacterium RIFCSPLOWO2_01_FULL_44_24]|uniref:Uncharacterized protein n=1 Tax=Candidatus Terrybacteria bacterium RIFCSPHIGHO2_01_FULL_43_35 TaxID=1802361 RepID=A0A1G2PBZ2_9BACT|nr:MAG: hypothetical protein A2828_01180 [Candidatus Terrybacteria bacterium RIFCSPHIGHO2_01_FULL_43_35]OHA49643.1 MAG: hypothetical protein A3B75_00960 [Candidatus Terrybacteria bacterium RIFCSPHIGHO2_02_FULL_43_14]OHA51308.1 MAG: hypothetical protein A3A80_04305 [Candidatus Terrybacteria bacterium RIFCSPLOWO2_01_FULL_44_24]